MWNKEFSLTLETDFYKNPLNNEESGMVEILATAFFTEDNVERVVIDKIYCTDTDKLVNLNEQDRQRAMRYLEVRAYDRLSQWVSEAELADYVRTEDWKVMELLGK